jgi:hypothetical protein
MRVRIILMNRMAFQPRFTWRKGMWNRRGVFFVRKDRERERLYREWERERAEKRQEREAVFPTDRASIILNAALPGDLELYNGEDINLRPVRPGPHTKAMPWSNEQTDSFRPDTEGGGSG